jgi:hypothetical protein
MIVMEKLYHINYANTRVPGPHSDIVNADNVRGNCINVCGNARNLTGDISGLTGDVTGLYGDATGVTVYLHFYGSMYFGNIEGLDNTNKNNVPEAEVTE